MTDNIQTFSAALDSMRKSANCQALSRKLGRPDQFIATTAYQIRNGSPVRQKTVDDLYRAFPMLESLVRCGMVQQPKIFAPPAGGKHRSPERMAELRAIKESKRAVAPARAASTAELSRKIDALTAKLHAAFPTVF